MHCIVLAVVHNVCSKSLVASLELLSEVLRGTAQRVPIESRVCPDGTQIHLNLLRITRHRSVPHAAHRSDAIESGLR